MNEFEEGYNKAIEDIRNSLSKTVSVKRTGERFGVKAVNWKTVKRLFEELKKEGGG